MGYTHAPEDPRGRGMSPDVEDMNFDSGVYCTGSTTVSHRPSTTTVELVEWLEVGSRGHSLLVNRRTKEDTGDGPR